MIKKQLKKNINESYSFTDKLLGGFGLTNLKNIYRIAFSGEACAIPNLYYYFGFTGTMLIMMPEKYSVADGGVYYYGEDFIFPLEKGGKPNLIIKKYESGEVLDEIKNIYRIKEWNETYKWTGEKAILISKSKIKRYIK